MFKKDFQKTISTIRKELGENEYPKAMCTGAQMMKNQATVNCGGEGRGEYTKKRAQAVLAHPAFKALLQAYDARAALEHKPDYTGNGYTQIRIQY